MVPSNPVFLFCFLSCLFVLFDCEELLLDGLKTIVIISNGPQCWHQGRTALSTTSWCGLVCKRDGCVGVVWLQWSCTWGGGTLVGRRCELLLSEGMKKESQCSVDWQWYFTVNNSSVNASPKNLWGPPWTCKPHALQNAFSQRVAVTDRTLGGHISGDRCELCRSSGCSFSWFLKTSGSGQDEAISEGKSHCWNTWGMPLTLAGAGRLRAASQREE